MKFKHLIITALRALRAQKSRSALTILGIVIGVAAIIVVMSIGSGAQSLILDQVSGLGAETIIVRPGPGLSNIGETLLSQALTEDDLKALEKKSNVPNLVDIAPFVFIAGAIEYEGEKFQPTIIGGPAEFISQVMQIYSAEGQLFSDEEIDSRAKVAVIGHNLKEEIFENRNAIGQSIQIRDKKFKIVSVLEKKSGVAGFDFNDMVMIPHTTAQAITGNDFYNELIISIDSIENVQKSVFDIEATLRNEHELSGDEENDFNVQTSQDAIDQIKSIVSILTAFLSLVVAVSLVVGGIGIMNIMLVSVTERTKEIGLRKALGARRTDILKQFLYEAIILTGIGGLIGMAIGALVSFTAAIILSRTVDEGWQFAFPISAAVLGVGVSAGVGLIFGIYPASQAAKKSPIEALRYE